MKKVFSLSVGSVLEMKATLKFLLLRKNFFAHNKLKIASWTVVTWNACWISKEREASQRWKESRKRSSSERISCKIGNSLNEFSPAFKTRKNSIQSSSSEASSAHFHRTDSQLFHKTERCVCEWLIKVNESLSKSPSRVRESNELLMDFLLNDTTPLLLPIMMTMAFYIQLLLCSCVEISGRLISIVIMDVRAEMSLLLIKFLLPFWDLSPDP